MSRFAYIWIIAAVALALAFHAHEEGERREAIAKATSDALYVGAMAGCKSNNQIIDQIGVLAKALHPSQREAVEMVLHKQGCQERALRIVLRYNRLADH